MTEQEHTIARLIHAQVDQLADAFVARVQAASLPGYGVFVAPVLAGGARALYGALAESMETGDPETLIARAREQAARRRQQGVLPEELAQVAEVYCLTLHDAGLATEDVPLADLLAAFVRAFTASPTAHPPRAPRPLPRPADSMQYGTSSRK